MFGIAVSKSRIVYILVTYIVKALPFDCTLTDSKTLHCTIKWVRRCLHPASCHPVPGLGWSRPHRVPHEDSSGGSNEAGACLLRSSSRPSHPLHSLISTQPWQQQKKSWVRRSRSRTTCADVAEAGLVHVAVPEVWRVDVWSVLSSLSVVIHHASQDSWCLSVKHVSQLHGVVMPFSQLNMTLVISSTIWNLGTHFASLLFFLFKQLILILATSSHIWFSRHFANVLICYSAVLRIRSC
jgi:hypothetical protein